MTQQHFAVLLFIFYLSRNIFYFFVTFLKNSVTMKPWKDTKSFHKGVNKMKKSKLALATILLSAALPLASCGGETASSSSETSEITLNHNLYTTDGNRRLSAEPSDDMINDFILDIVSKGASAMAGGIGTYAKNLTISLLKECGIDLRDATAKTLEKIQQQLTAIENKLTAIADKMERDHSELILSPVLKQLKQTQFNYGEYSVNSIQYLASLEEQGTLSEEQIEQERVKFYNESLKKLLPNNLPLATYVTTLADLILKPNEASGKGIFYYYFETIAYNDVWSIQRLKNVRSFIAYLDSVLFLTANLAKFQMYYLAQGKSGATVEAYKGMMNTMATSVNAVNDLFKKQLESMKEYEDKWAGGENIYLPTGKVYSTRLATLTYDHNEVVDGDSRQALLMRYDNSHGKHFFGEWAYAYTPDSTTVNGFANSFREYAGEYCTSDYTIQDYLTYCGFYAKNEDLFNKAAGIYKGDMDVDKHGYIHDDHDYTIGYYNTQGVYSTKKVYEVCTYHKWGFEIDYAELRYFDDRYYFCFTVKDGDKEYLDGTYVDTYMEDPCYKVIDEGIQYEEDYYKLLGNHYRMEVRDSW